MALAKKCDICGAFYTPYGSIGKRDEKHPNGFQLLNIDEHEKYFANGAIDCCPDCMASVLSFVDILKRGEKVNGIPF